ncbi:MAG: rhomboid family intramembrane serine protease [Verrucomicrobiota bacterium]|nr:rhomboid family intramembrane serine protease [Verrucomicrobiota bacterium]
METRRIIARTQKQAMDWSLVLASQGIEPIILHEENNWELRVGETDYENARAAIRQYRRENRGWNFQQNIRGLLFHWGSLFWVIALWLFYYWSEIRFPSAKILGLMDNRGIFSGEWWRIFTAMTLHGDITHALANATTGFLLLGLAMARYGFGWALLASYIAGAGGNFLGAIFYSEIHRSLGASGMVTGALGLLATQLFFEWRKNHWRRRIIIRSLAGGILILVLIGFGENADLVAHLGGFFFGSLLGCLLNSLPSRFSENLLSNQLALFLLGIWIALTWGLALR